MMKLARVRPLRPVPENETVSRTEPPTPPTPAPPSAPRSKPGERPPAYYSRRRKRGNEICQILIRRGDVDPEAVRHALRLQEERGGQIGRILVALGACTEEAIARALLEQLRLRADPEANLSVAARENPHIAGLKVRSSARKTLGVLLAADALALGVSVALGLGVAALVAGGAELRAAYVLIAAYILAGGSFLAVGLYSAMALSPPDEIRETTKALFLSGLALATLLLVEAREVASPRLLALGTFACAGSLLVPLGRAAARARFAKSAFWGHPVVVLGAGKTGRLIVRTLREHPELGLRPVFVLDDDPRKQGTLQARVTAESVEVRSRAVSSDELLTESVRMKVADLMEDIRRSRASIPDGDAPPASTAPPSRSQLVVPTPAPRGMFAEVEGVPVVGDLTLAPVLAERLGIRYAIMAMPGVASERLVHLVERVGGVFSHLLIIPDLFGFGGMGVPAKDVGGVLGLEVRQQLLLPGPRLAKRVMDLVLTAIGGLFLLPIVLLLGLAIRLDSPGPALFFQNRLGKDGKPFRAAKFRTMHVDAEQRLEAVLKSDGALRAEYEQFHKLTNDPRVTRIGRVLRKYSLDELPQLLNVLRGEMSLVGPRPYLQREVPDMDQKEGIILRVLPGMTGMWQVSKRNSTTFAHRVKMDVYYVRNWSPWLDLYVLARTVGVVAGGTGV